MICNWKDPAAHIYHTTNYRLSLESYFEMRIEMLHLPAERTCRSSIYYYDECDLNIWCSVKEAAMRLHLIMDAYEQQITKRRFF